MSKKQPSLELLLKQLSTEPVPNDPKRRSRIELLALALWQKALNGDKDSQRMLLDRLPVSPAEVPVPPAAPTASDADPYSQVLELIKGLISAGVLPVEAFATFTPQGADTLKIEQ